MIKKILLILILISISVFLYVWSNWEEETNQKDDSWVSDISESIEELKRKKEREAINDEKMRDIFKCPEEMSSFDEYVSNRTEIMSLVLLENGNISQEDMSVKILKLADERDCTNDVGYLREYGQEVSGEEAPFVLVSSDQLKRGDLIEYKTDFGFSFKYPPNTDVFEVSEGNTWIVVTNKNDDNAKIIISISANIENISAEDWFLGPDSGFDSDTEVFFRTEIDGQSVVYTDFGTWVVFNTPVDNYRVSIAELTVEDSEVMYEEMGIILGTLKFE